MSSIVNEPTLVKIEGARKYIQRTAVWLLIGTVALGAILILFAGDSSWEVIWKFLGTIVIIALMLIISANNFKLVASRIAYVQVFALIGLVSNLVWAILWIIICWNPELGIISCNKNTCGVSMILRFASAFSYLSFLGLAGSNVLALTEGTRRSIIRPLKITSVAMAIYEVGYFVVMDFVEGYNFSSDLSVRFGMLAGFLGFAWMIVTVVVAGIAKSEKNKMGLESKKTEENINPETVQGVNVGQVNITSTENQEQTGTQNNIGNTQ